jgi:hypothetical protein
MERRPQGVKQIILEKYAKYLERMKKQNQKEE